MTLSAPLLESWDRCRRFWQFNQDWQPARVTPLGAVYGALHRVLTCDPYPGPGMAREYVMQLAGERGVETTRQDVYDMMTHYAHLAEVLARVLRQPTAEPLPRPMRVPTVGKIGPHDWEMSSYFIDGGMRLMRFVLVDHWGDDRLMHELHSWRTVGDVCVAQLPMTIRVLVLGASKGGKRHGYWTRAHKHPYTKQLRFARKHDKEAGFTESWKPVWREESGVGPDAWIEQMARDKVLREVAFEQKVVVPGEGARARVLADITKISEEMERSWWVDEKFPMTRSACDMIGMGACRYQCVCMAPTEIGPGEAGVFIRRQGR